MYLKANITCNDLTKTIEYDGTESDLWKQVGECLLTISVPNTMKITTHGHGAAELDISKRGTFVHEGKRLPSMYVKESYNNIDTKASDYEEAYLKCVNPEGNNYKFYRLIPIVDYYGVRIDAEYGSIDDDTCAPRHLQDPYPSYMYWIRYYEKLSKGYKDYTKIQLQSKTVEGLALNSEEDTSDTSVNAVLYRELMAYANHVVRESLLDPKNITIAQVKEARKEFNKLCAMKTYTGFNTHLVNLLALSPRNIGNRMNQAHMMSLMPKNYSYLQNTEERKEKERAEMNAIIDREETLLLAMEAVAGMAQSDANLSKLRTSFLQYQIEVEIASAKERDFVISHLQSSQKHLVDTVYKVVPKTQSKNFDAYVKKNKIKTIEHLWHGSVNANWASIIQNSLQMRPAANGRMFGDGHYFALSSDKSFGYTSYRGSRWASGNDTVAFMGLYKVAYGNPWLVSSSGHHYCEDLLHQKGYDCVHAKARNTGLRADEIIVYNNDALCLEYLVKFKD